MAPTTRTPTRHKEASPYACPASSKPSLVLIDTRCAGVWAISISDALEDAGRPHAGADAHRDHAVLQAVPAQRMHHRRGADRTCCAERMAERDRAAHRIDLASVEPEVVDHRECLRCKRFVQFYPAHVVGLQA